MSPHDDKTLVKMLRQGWRGDTASDLMREAADRIERAAEAEETGASLIAAERRRQVDVEGYTAEHDQGHEVDLVRAAMSYMRAALFPLNGLQNVADPMQSWPWSSEHWKPTGDPRRDLTKAGALIAATIDALPTPKSEER